MLRKVAGSVVLLILTSPVQAQDPDAEIRFGAGVRMIRDGFPDRALVEIQQALKKDPTNAFYLKGLGVAYSQLADRCKPADSGCRNGNLKKAAEAAQKSLELNPDYVDARNDLGIALLRLGKRTDGKAELARAFADPQCPTPELTAWNLGQAFFEEREYAEAMTWFQAAQNRNKSLAAPYVSMADVLIITGQPENAIVRLEAGLKETEGNTVVQLSLGEAYLRVGRFQDARAAFEQVVKKDPTGSSGLQAAEKLRGFPR
ncbi:MAG: tetratricopeptide repeat protein [Vicinamibacteria bacterium]|nr:tetratricopeptide repeat protein [Vicinamibacteria bacterium]